MGNRPQTLCTQAIEYDVPIGAETRREIDELGRLTDVDVARLVGED